MKFDICDLVCEHKFSVAPKFQPDFPDTALNYYCRIVRVTHDISTYIFNIKKYSGIQNYWPPL